MKSIQAFTFYEVLIVLTISMIVAGIALPACKRFFVNTNDTILQKNILDELSFARSQAQARGTAIAILKNKSWINGQLIIVDANDDGSITNNKQILSTVQTQFAHGELSWRGFPFYRDYLQFLPSGLLLSANGTFWHCHEHVIRWAITLNKAGLTQIEYPDKSGNIVDSEGKKLIC